MVAGVAGARYRWWIIGSAAVALHGADPGPVGDVDLLIDPRDAPDLFGAWQIANVAGRERAIDARFASEWFGRVETMPMPVEVMAGLRVRAADGWGSVRLVTHRPVVVGAVPVFVPDIGELHALLLRFGRTKDVRRAAALAVTASKRTRTC